MSTQNSELFKEIVRRETKPVTYYYIAVYEGSQGLLSEFKLGSDQKLDENRTEDMRTVEKFLVEYLGKQCRGLRSIFEAV